MVTIYLWYFLIKHPGIYTISRESPVFSNVQVIPSNLGDLITMLFPKV